MKFKSIKERDDFIINLPYYLSNRINKLYPEAEMVGIDDAWIDEDNDVIIFDSWKPIPDLVKRDLFGETGFKIVSRYHRGVFDGDGGYRHKIELNVKPLNISIEEVRDNIYDLIKN